MFREGILQIGKSGLTEGTITSLNNLFKIHSSVRISLLKTSTRNRNEVKEIAEKIISKIKYKCRYRIIGFTIILKK